MNDFTKLLNSISKTPLKVIDASIDYKHYIPISISLENNKDLRGFDISSSRAWEEYLTYYLDKQEAEVAYGGYLEKRDIYKRSTYFNNKKPNKERNIHLGIDLWTKVETPVLAVLDGEIHSFKNNTNFGDYGPTIILKHSINGMEFYSLYGHLSLESLSNIKENQKVAKGDIIGTLGSYKVNGDYAPHLHFQLIKHLEGREGDYFGVCAEKDIIFYEENCPNPNLLLKLPSKILSE